MKDIIFNILTFVIIAISLIVILKNSKNKKTEDTYLSEGMCIGMSIGVAFSCLLENNMGLGISLGMLVGEAIGISIKKNNNR